MKSTPTAGVGRGGISLRVRRAFLVEMSCSRAICVRVPRGFACRVDYAPGESGDRHLRRQFELARPGLDAGQLPARGVAYISSTDYYGDDFLVEFPVGSGQMVTLTAIADKLRGRLARLFLRGADGRRPCLGRQGTVTGRTPLRRPSPVQRVLSR